MPFNRLKVLKYKGIIKEEFDGEYSTDNLPKK